MILTSLFSSSFMPQHSTIICAKIEASLIQYMDINIGPQQDPIKIQNIFYGRLLTYFGGEIFILWTTDDFKNVRFERFHGRKGIYGMYQRFSNDSKFTFLFAKLQGQLIQNLDTNEKIQCGSNEGAQQGSIQFQFQFNFRKSEKYRSKNHLKNLFTSVLSPKRLLIQLSLNRNVQYRTVQKECSKVNVSLRAT